MPDALKPEFLLPFFKQIEASGKRSGIMAEVAQAAGINRATLSTKYNAWKRQGKQDNTTISNTPPQSGTVMVIPDMHHPFCHQDALAFLKAVKDKYNPSSFVCLGDEIDAHALSRYPKDPNGLSAGSELSAAIESLIPFYLEFPNMLVCESNHTVRGHKLAFQAGIPQAFLKHISTILNAPDGWVWASKHIGLVRFTALLLDIVFPPIPKVSLGFAGYNGSSIHSDTSACTFCLRGGTGRKLTASQSPKTTQ